VQRLGDGQEVAQVAEFDGHGGIMAFGLPIV